MDGVASLLLAGFYQSFVILRLLLVIITAIDLHLRLEKYWLRNNKKTWKLGSRERDELLVMLDIYDQEKGKLMDSSRGFNQGKEKKVIGKCGDTSYKEGKNQRWTGAQGSFRQTSA